MRRIGIQVLISCLLLSCSNINRDKLVDKTDLTADDYRLFQCTPAWELAKAVEDENVSKIDAVVAGNPQIVNYQEPKYGNTLLHLSIMNQQLMSFRTLLKEKADISVHNTYDGTSPLIEACSYKQYDARFAKILLQNGANVNDIETGKRREGNSTRLTPLMAASRQGNIDLVKLLVSKGADINYKNEFRQSALSECILVNELEVGLYLLRNGADYKQPIFYRPGDSADYNPAEDKPMYLVDVLREEFFELDTREYKYKMQIVDFLKSRGVDYKSIPIADFIKRKAHEKYPNNWKEYLDKY